MAHRALRLRSWLAGALVIGMLLMAGLAGAAEDGGPATAAEVSQEGLESRGPSPLNPGTLATAWSRLSDQIGTVGDSFQRLTREGELPLDATWVLGLGLLVGLIAGGMVRRGSGTGIRRLGASGLGTRTRALMTGLLTALRYRAFSLAVPAALLIGLEGLQARSTTAGTLAVAGLGLFALYRLGVAFFPVLGRPFDPASLARRLEQAPIHRLWRAGRHLFALTLLGIFLLIADQGLAPDPELRGVGQFLFSLVVLAVLLRLRDREAWLQVAGGASISAFRRFLVGGGRAALDVAAVVPVVASALGYQALSATVLVNLLLTVVILLTMGTLGAGLARALRRLEFAQPPEAVAPVVTPQRLGRVTKLIAGLVRGLAVAVALVAVLAVWDFPLGRVWAVVEPLLFGFQLGGYRLSLIALIAAVVVLIAAFYLGRWLRRRMLTDMLPKVTDDAGLRNSIASLVYYVVLVLGVLLAISVAGFDLTNLALIAGALSVGIGFGLQNVVNNFVSGLILLFERPIKVGDVIEYHGQWAIVQEIKVRSTLIQTYDRADLIVPNSELVSTTVTNWTHRGQLARVILQVGVAYGSETPLVRDLLLQAAAEHPQVQTDPEPVVLFRDFGDSALDFELRCFTDVDHYLSVPSDIRFRIDELFREHDITIPFPQRDVHLFPEVGGDTAEQPG